MDSDDDDFKPSKFPKLEQAKAETAPKQQDLKRKNSPRCTTDMTEWPERVLQEFSSKLKKNRNSFGEPYWIEAPLHPDDPQGTLGPPELQKERCHFPAGSNNLMFTFCFCQPNW